MSLVDHLRGVGVTVVPTGSVTQPFFAVSGQVIKVNGEQVRIYEYADEEAANADVAHISSDGGTVGNTMVDWIAPPHFYKKGQLIVLYVGINISVIHILETSLGPQYAGR